MIKTLGICVVVQAAAPTVQQPVIYLGDICIGMFYQAALVRETLTKRLINPTGVEMILINDLDLAVRQGSDQLGFKKEECGLWGIVLSEKHREARGVKLGFSPEEAGKMIGEVRRKINDHIQRLKEYVISPGQHDDIEVDILIKVGKGLGIQESEELKELAEIVKGYRRAHHRVHGFTAGFNEISELVRQGEGLLSKSESADMITQANALNHKAPILEQQKLLLAVALSVRSGQSSELSTVSKNIDDEIMKVSELLERVRRTERDLRGIVSLRELMGILEESKSWKAKQESIRESVERVKEIRAQLDGLNPSLSILEEASGIAMYLEKYDEFLRSALDSPSALLAELNSQIGNKDLNTLNEYRKKIKVIYKELKRREVGLTALVNAKDTLGELLQSNKEFYGKITVLHKEVVEAVRQVKTHLEGVHVMIEYGTLLKTAEEKTKECTGVLGSLQNGGTQERQNGNACVNTLQTISDAIGKLRGDNKKTLEEKKAEIDSLIGKLKAGLKPKTTEANKKEESKKEDEAESNWLTIVGIVVAVLAVGAAGIFFYSRQG